MMKGGHNEDKEGIEKAFSDLQVQELLLRIRPYQNR